MRTVRDTFDLCHEALKLDPRERVRAEKMHVEITLLPIWMAARRQSHRVTTRLDEASI